MNNQTTLVTKIFKNGKVFTFSNFLSFIRLPIGILCYFLIYNKQTDWAVFLIIIAIISDFADGYFARKWNQVSELGKVLDPIGDKVCVALGCVALYQSYQLPLWIMVLIICRDLLILLGSILLVTRLPFVTPSNWAGKVAVTFISLMLASYLLEFTDLQIPLQIATVVALVISGLQYAKNFYVKFFKEKPIES